MTGRTVEDYRAPLFVAWQLTNRCQGRCACCCEESGPDKAWADELRRDEALDIAHAIAELGVPYVAFGGGEPLGVPFCWELFEILFRRAGVAIKLETDGSHIDEAAADRLAKLRMQCIQISVDGASESTYSRMRPGQSFTAAIAAIQRLVARGLAPQFVFVPTRINLGDIVPAFELAAHLGCSAFVTGPLMRIGRAAAQWEWLSVSEASWQQAVEDLRRHSRDRCRASRFRSIRGTS